MSSCPAADELLAYLEGNLATDHLDHIGRHIEACDVCVAALIELESQALASHPLVKARLDSLGYEEDSDEFIARIQPLLKSVPNWSRAATSIRDRPGDDGDPSSHDSDIRAGESETTVHHPKKSSRTLAMSLQPGQIFGAYEILEELAHGGMGVVYKARQTKLNRIVALKTVLGGRQISAEEARRFENEALAAARLHHPNIVAIHEVNEADGQCYICMDFVDGRDLSEIVREAPLSAREAAQYGRGIAEAMHYAHEQGIVHRDLKPSNIMIDRNDQVRITDFGLAKQLDHDTRLTATGQVMGTPSYMSPEQASGRNETMGPATDVYSLGAILYESITARPPFRAETSIETLKQVQECEPPAPRLLNQSIPRDLETICLKCLEKSPHDRYDSAQSLADDLARFLRGKPILARPHSPAERLWRWCRRNTIAAIAVSLVLLILLAVPVGSVVFVAYDLDMARQNAIDRMTTLANFAGTDIVAAIDFVAPGSAKANESLSKFVTEPRVELASVYTDDGPFATYSQPSSTVQQPQAPGEDGHRFTADGHLELVVPVKRSADLGGQRVGTIFLRVNVYEIDTRFRRLVAIVVGLFLGSVMAAAGFLYGVYRYATDPRHQLRK